MPTLHSGRRTYVLREGPGRGYVRGRGAGRAGLACLLCLSSFLFLVPGQASEDAGLAGALAPTAAADPSGTGISGDAWTVGPGLATAANQASQMTLTSAAASALLEQMAALNAALQSKLFGGTAAQGALAEGSAKEIVGALERMTGTLSADLEAAQHNPLVDEAPCADLASAMANTGQQRSREEIDAAQETTLDETRRDSSTRNFAQAQGQQDVVLLDSDLLKDESVFRPGWLLPPGGLIPDPAKSTYMIGVLSNPTPSPKVGDEAAMTPGGRKGASALKIKSAQTGVAEGALRFVSQFFLPLADYGEAVPELEEEAGVDPADRKERDELGYSLMQYFQARQQHFSGNVNGVRKSIVWNQSDTLRHMDRILAETYHLQLETLRASLYQTALLATLVGIESKEQNAVAERFLVPLRQPKAESR